MPKKILVAVVIVLAAGIAAARLVSFDASAIGRRTLREVSAATHVRLNATAFRFNLLTGLDVEQVEASSLFPGGRYHVTVPRIRFEHRWLPLLAGRLEIEAVSLASPRVMVTLRREISSEEEEEEEGEDIASGTPADEARRRRPEPEGSVDDAPPELPASPVELRIRELIVSGGALSLDGVVAEGIDATLVDPALRPGALSIVHAISTRGELSVDSLAVGERTARGLAATIDGDRGRFELADLSIETDEGSFSGDVAVDVNSIPARHRMNLSAELRVLPGTVHVELEGFGLDPANLDGDGEWVLPAGAFDDAPLWRVLELSGTPYGASTIVLRIADGRIVLDGDWIAGAVDVDGRLELIVDGRRVSGTWREPELSRVPTAR